MKVNCDECGYQGEIDGRTWSPKLRCQKCGIANLQRGEILKTAPAESATKLPTELPKPAQTEETSKVLELVGKTPQHWGGSCGKQIYVRKYQLEENLNAPRRCKQCQNKIARPPHKIRQGVYESRVKENGVQQITANGIKPELERGKIVLINREVLLNYLQDLREDFTKVKSNSQITLGLSLVIRVLEMMEKDVFIIPEGESNAKRT